MRIKTSLIATSLMLALAACGKGGDNSSTTQGDTPVAAAPDGTDWSQAIVETPEGGYLMGNPDAPVKLVEYASLTCPHCKDFSAEAGEALVNTYVKSGRVSWEFRSFALNPIDVSATLLAACQGPQAFFTLLDQVYAAQSDWVMPFQSISPEAQNGLAKLPQSQQFLGLARAGNLDAFFRARGLPAAKAEACLTDAAAIQKLVDVRERGIKADNVEGTPTFLINGKKVETAPSWAAIEPEIKKALD